MDYQAGGDAEGKTPLQRALGATENEKLPFDARTQELIEALQHSHVEVTMTTKGPTFSIKVRNIDPFIAAERALKIYKELKAELIG